MRQLSSTEIQSASGGASIWDAVYSKEFSQLIFANFLKNPIGTIGGLLGIGVLYVLLGSDL
jgi:hypothetical protein